MSIPTCATRDAADYIRQRRPFKTHGSLMGMLNGPYSYGHMPEPHSVVYMRHRHRGLIAYTVVSYETPIAWVLDDGRVFVPPVKYSVTTSKHQSACPLTMEVDG